MAAQTRSGSQIPTEGPSCNETRSPTQPNTLPHPKPGSVGDEQNKHIKSDGGVKKAKIGETPQLMCWAYEVDSAKLTLAEKLEKSKWDSGNCGEK